MTKQDFLDKLRTSLSNDFAAAEVQEQVSYYSDYINGEIARGRSESDVIAELGDPWIIARSLVNSKADQMESIEDGDGYTSYSGRDVYQKRSEYTEDGYYQDEKINPIKKYLFEHPSVMKAVVIGGIILVVLLVLTIVMGIFQLIAPVLVPVLVILFVFRLIKGDRYRRNGGWGGFWW